MIRILMIGDIVGAPGRRALRAILPDLRRREAVDLCVVNAENAAAGLGLTASLAADILSCGADVLTTGNHVWARHELLDAIDAIPRLVRPLNGPPCWPGRTHVVLSVAGVSVLVTNALGRVGMDPADCPFRAIDALLETVRSTQDVPLAVVDFHAEATAEKAAMAWHLDGHVTLVAGTHTHVQTSDARILPRGTAFITDVGMTGATDGIIGMDVEASLRRIVDRLPSPYVGARGPAVLEAVLVEADPLTGRASSILAFRIPEPRDG